MIEETLKIATTPQGLPFFERNPDIRLSVDLAEIDPDGGKDVEISGDSASLRRLGELLIGMSRCKSYHVHLEDDETSPIVIDGNGLRVTITNTDDAPVSSKPDTLPPEWAR